ncbi:double-strand break repair helicase AddA [Alphaproteobacteria bacterium KMM 3653]|uniref:DNA 3'-5' helicase n=1 Tax=Harenicola maris TaxID=2841044 RepID=A0AAP2CNI3_9RHOB|nr:double-strand break repair helicase AddA [Harenicola maris]
MTVIQMDDATRAQVEAAAPHASTWLAANAGSGKTRVLTDRVARLLLQDVAPQNILCLTYTKAAASEMQNRLFKRLGEWAMLDDADLTRQLADLGGTPPEGAEQMRKARRLFARAIEAPGGLKIQTIHSFCASLLRRFPLEAGVSPGFTEIDDRAAQLLRRDILNWIASEHPQTFTAFLGTAGGADLEDLTQDIAAQRSTYPDTADMGAIRMALGLPADMTLADSFALALDGSEAALLADVNPLLQGSTATMQSLAQAMAEFIAAPGPDTFPPLAKCVLYADRNEVKATFLTKTLRKSLSPEQEQAIEDFAARISDAMDAQNALASAEKTFALHAFAALFLAEYARRKDAAGWLDFEDLLLSAHALLTQSDMAGWVLYRLDGGIDHVLVDEAQDTSPLQWKIIERLTEELTSGEGSRPDTPRTLFVVGDKKQSIYSFQGADPAEFDRMKTRFDTALAGATGLASRKLEYSFRSSATILTAVDATFREGQNDGLETDVSHAAFFGEMPGRVDLWPVIEPEKDTPDTDWNRPSGETYSTQHNVELARRIAAEITRMKEQEVLWHRDKTGQFQPRRITEGDVLILVQRRADLFHEILRACKSAGLRVAGADRVKLHEELAVRDILSLLSFLLTPEDDLALAEALKSPLFGWSEQQLFDLAAHRGDRLLWPTLRGQKDKHPETVALIQDMLNKADFLRPYELLDRLLTHHHGRRRLLGRLGQEATEGIDLLCEQALALEQSSVPSLTGFVAWLSSEEVDLKRQPDAAGTALRVMSVHGAKGLEAPIVFLPDAVDRKEMSETTLQTPHGPIWRPSKGNRPRAFDPLAEAASQKTREERARLLYVAMTRAEQWLILCAAGKAEDPEKSWHARVATGLDVLETSPLPLPGLGEGRRFQSWPAATPPAADTPALDKAKTLPDWAETPVPAAKPAVKPLSPSRLTGAKALPGEGAVLSEEAAMARGTLMHLLLEVLPTRDRADWAALETWAIGTLGPEPAFDTAQVVAEARGVITNPALAPLFAPDTLTEVPVTAPLAGQTLYGTIDKLIVAETHILAVDFKSNVTVPSAPAQTPIGVLRQMGAYAQALSQIYPGRRIDTAILWTATASLMPLPHSLVIEALQSEPLLDAPPTRP